MEQTAEFHRNHEGTCSRCGEEWPCPPVASPEVLEPGTIVRSAAMSSVMGQVCAAPRGVKFPPNTVEYVWVSWTPEEMEIVRVADLLVVSSNPFAGLYSLREVLMTLAEVVASAEEVPELIDLAHARIVALGTPGML